MRHCAVSHQAVSLQWSILTSCRKETVLLGELGELAGREVAGRFKLLGGIAEAGGSSALRQVDLGVSFMDKKAHMHMDT